MQTLLGLRIQEQQGGLQSLLAGSPSSFPVFTDEQVQYLAPRIAQALMTATAEEAVAFRVTHSRPGSSRLESDSTETTAGSLYAYGRSLHVTLSQYRFAPTQANADSAARRQLPDPSGLSGRTLHFTPTAAQLPEGNYPLTRGAANDRSVGIDYQVLQPQAGAGAVMEPAVSQAEQLPPPVIERTQGSRASDTSSQTAEALAQREAEIQALKDLVIKKELELESLKKDLQSVRKQLDSQTAGPDNKKRKATSPPRLQKAAP